LFTTDLSSVYTGAFTVESEIFWEASSSWPIYHVGIRLLDSDGNVKLLVRYYDAWAGSTRRKYAKIEGSSHYVNGLPLSGQAAIQITRDSNDNVQIFWGGSLLHSGVSTTAIAKLQIRITCHQTYTGGKAGVNYIRSIGG
jgi:hypothetical protein